MSTIDDTPLPSISTDILVPTDQYKEPLLWDENLATIPGMLNAIKKYYTRTGLFGPLLEHRAVALSNGKLATAASSGASISSPPTFRAPSSTRSRIWRTPSSRQTTS